MTDVLDLRPPSPMQRVLDPANRADPYPLYAELRRQPVWREPDGSYVVARYADVASLIRDPRLSADPGKSPRGGGGISFLNMDPPDHDRLRRQTNRHFGPPNAPDLVESMTPMLERAVSALIDSLRGSSEFDLVSQVAYPFPVTVIADLLGVPREDEPKFHAWAEAITQASDRDPRQPGRRPESAEKALQALGGYMFGLVEARRVHPQDDLISKLLHDAGPDGPMQPGELAGVGVLLLLAGHETTVNLISNGLLTMLRQPHLVERLRADPGLAPAFVEELLRFEPPVHFTFRSTLCDVRVQGETIPGGSSVQLMLAAANRDPAQFEDPDTYVPERRNNQHLGFGSGIHICFGAPLARLEAQIALKELARRLVKPRLTTEPQYRFSPTLRGPREVRVAMADVI